jgi:hypothetical protein
LADVFKKMIAARYPDLDSFHVVDESLLPELIRSDGVMTPGLVRQHAARLGRSVHVQARLESAAFEAAMVGDKTHHDELVRQVAAELSRECVMVVLAQASMAHLAPELNESLRMPVLAGSDLFLADYLKD